MQIESLKVQLDWTCFVDGDLVVMCEVAPPAAIESRAEVEG